MQIREIPRISGMPKDEFQDYIATAQNPLVITDCMRDWPAMEAWSFDFFAEKFANFDVEACAPQFSETAAFFVKTTVARYIEYLKAPERGEIEGTWVRGDKAGLLASGLTLYAGDFTPADPVRGNGLIFDYVPRVPHFIDSWCDRLEPPLKRFCETSASYHNVLLSTTGALSPLHEDFWFTHAFLAQILGSKRATLFSPDFAPILNRSSSRMLAELQNEPFYHGVEGWQAQLSKGEMLIIPSNWLHHVETLEKSITYSMNWIDASNWEFHQFYAEQAFAAEGASTAGATS